MNALEQIYWDIVMRTRARYRASGKIQKWRGATVGVTSEQFWVYDYDAHWSTGETWGPYPHASFSTDLVDTSAILRACFFVPIYGCDQNPIDYSDIHAMAGEFLWFFALIVDWPNDPGVTGMSTGICSASSPQWGHWTQKICEYGDESEIYFQFAFKVAQVADSGGYFGSTKDVAQQWGDDIALCSLIETRIATYACDWQDEFVSEVGTRNTTGSIPTLSATTSVGFPTMKMTGGGGPGPDIQIILNSLAQTLLVTDARNFGPGSMLHGRRVRNKALADGLAFLLTSVPTLCCDELSAVTVSAATTATIVGTLKRAQRTVGIEHGPAGGIKDPAYWLPGVLYEGGGEGEIVVPQESVWGTSESEELFGRLTEPLEGLRDALRDLAERSHSLRIGPEGSWIPEGPGGRTGGRDT